MTHLLGYLSALHRGQGLGFLLYSKVLDKRVVSALFKKVLASGSTLVVVLIQYGQGTGDYSACSLTPMERGQLWIELHKIVSGDANNANMTSCSYEQLCMPMFGLQ